MPSKKDNNKFNTLFDLLEKVDGWLEITKPKFEQPIVRAHKPKVALGFEQLKGKDDSFDQAAGRLMLRLKNEKRIK